MPIVTLTTDIGQQDYLVGAIKGQLLSACTNIIPVDVTHYLSAFNYPQAAYICNNAFKHYPPETIHIVIVNLFDVSPDCMLLAKYNDQYIICPNNGILTMITGNIPAEVVCLSDDTSAKNLLHFTNLAANCCKLLNDKFELRQIGNDNVEIVEKYPLRATFGADWMEGHIIFIDNFENVVVNITKEEFEQERKERNFKIEFTRNEIIDKISEHYADVTEGEKLAWFNSAGYLEIAVNKGNMAGLFGLQGFNEKMHQQGTALQNKWFYQTVRIFFW